MNTFKNRFVLVLLSAVFIVPLSGCKREGCTDSRAVNYDSKAGKDDGNCTYTTVIFQADMDDVVFPGSVNIGTTTLKLNGSTIGTVDNGGSFSYQLRDSNTQTWNAEATITAVGIDPITIANSGTLVASPTQPTLTVNVWE